MRRCDRNLAGGMTAMAMALLIGAADRGVAGTAPRTSPIPATA